MSQWEGLRTTRVARKPPPSGGGGLMCSCTGQKAPLATYFGAMWGPQINSQKYKQATT